MELPNNKLYNIIYADPPWKYKQGKSMGTQFQGACDRHYNTMDIKKICELPINDIAAKDSILFMWCTFPMLQEGLEVIKAWGFQYKTIGFNWLKLNKDGTPFFGVGYYVKSNGEICLLATKGHPHKFVINNEIRNKLENFLSISASLIFTLNYIKFSIICVFT